MDDTLRDQLVGDWQAELSGTDLLDLQPVEDRSRLQIALRTDGTASWRYPQATTSDTAGKVSPPFPEVWTISEDRVLTIEVPIPPMPEYELLDWSREAVRYDILAVSDISLGISNRRFDGEQVIVLRRLNAEEHGRRQVQRYLEAVTRVRGATSSNGPTA